MHAVAMNKHIIKKAEVLSKVHAGRNGNQEINLLGLNIGKCFFALKDLY